MLTCSGGGNEQTTAPLVRLTRTVDIPFPSMRRAKPLLPRCPDCGLRFVGQFRPLRLLRRSRPLAVLHDDAETLRDLLNKHPDLVDSTNRSGITLLMLACRQGSASCSELLLSSGATPNARSRGRDNDRTGDINKQSE